MYSDITSQPAVINKQMKDIFIKAYEVWLLPLWSKGYVSTFRTSAGAHFTFGLSHYALPE